MALSVTCENCDREMRVKDEAAGKSVRCPGCSEPVRVPTPRAAKPTARKPKPAAPTPDDGDVDWGKAAAMASNADEATKPCPACGEDVGLKDVKCESCGEKLIGKKSAKAGSKTRRSVSGESMDPVLIAVIALTAISLVCMAIGLAIPGARPVAAIVASLAGLCLTLVGFVLFLKAAAEESTAAVLMCLFVPCYSLYFLCTNWETAGKPFGVQCLGNLLVVLATGLMAPPQ